MCNSHAYKDVWSPIIREESFESLRENENKIPSLQWQFIVMAFVINRLQDMYHIISKCFSSFYCYNSVLLCEVIGEQTHSGQLRLHTTRESEKTKTIEKMKNQCLDLNSRLLFFHCLLNGKNFYDQN